MQSLFLRSWKTTLFGSRPVARGLFAAGRGERPRSNSATAGAGRNGIGDHHVLRDGLPYRIEQFRGPCEREPDDADCLSSASRRLFPMKKLLTCFKLSGPIATLVS